MISPQDQRIIQIDVTNACIHKCSNCTRFCGHHKKPFFMDMATFKRAVDSLDGYVGTVGIMGGEPTLNPHFEEMAEYLASKREPKKQGALIRPQAHFMDEIHDVEMEHTFVHKRGDVERRTVNGPGLWSAMGENYKKYYETIQDTITYQALNDHSNVMYHQPALISRHDLNIPDKEWIPMRDACWVQNLWSACITPKGAFFCEIAGALDMLFDGPGGWEIEPGWWKKTPGEFGEQLKWCEICGLALDTFMRNANEEMDDVSPELYEKLKRIDSPGLRTGRVNLLQINNGVISEESKALIEKRKDRSGDMPYTESYSARYDEKKTNLFHKEIRVISMAEIEKGTFGQLLYKELFYARYDQYLLIMVGEVKETGAIDALMHLVTNPGTLLYRKYDRDINDEYFEANQGAQVMLLCGIAHSIRDTGWDRILKLESLEQLVKIWQPAKVVLFAPEMVKTVPAVEIQKDLRYLIFGAGRILEKTIDKIESCGGRVTGVVDSDVELCGRNIFGYDVGRPEDICYRKDEYDIVMIAVGPRYREVKEMLLGYGLSEKEMAWI